MESKKDRVEGLILEYAVRHNCSKTFQALYTEDKKSRLPRLTLALYAIQQVIQKEEVEKYDVAMAILCRIYTTHCKQYGYSYHAYWKLMLGMKIKVVLRSAVTQSQEEFLQKARDLFTGKNIILQTETEKEVLKVRKRLWTLYRAFSPQICCPDRRKSIPHSSGKLLTDTLSKAMTGFSSPILDQLPPCDFETLMKETSMCREGTVFTDDDLIQLLSNNSQMNKLEKAFREREEKRENDVCRDEEKFSQASLVWNRPSTATEDELSLIAPSVTETSSDVQLSDLEEGSLEFKDNVVPTTPDLKRFLQTSPEK